MKITINDSTVFRFPTWLVVNRLTAGIIRGQLKKRGFRLTRKQTGSFIKELKQYKKRHPKWILVETTEKDGDSVTVKI